MYGLARERSPVISGFVNIAAACYIGAAAALRQRVRIKHGALVGLGSVVTRDVEEGVIVAGDAARPLRHRRTRRLLRVPESRSSGERSRVLSLKSDDPTAEKKRWRSAVHAYWSPVIAV